MAVKIVRQPNQIALIGAPSSAAAFSSGSEKAPAALRAAGLIEKLKDIGYEVTDFGDCAPQVFAEEDEHKRARNLPAIVASLHDLKPERNRRSSPEHWCWCWEATVHKLWRCSPGVGGITSTSAYFGSIVMQILILRRRPRRAGLMAWYWPAFTGEDRRSWCGSGANRR